MTISIKKNTRSRRSVWGDSRAGFSLLELLLYIAILAIITTFVTGAFFSINQGRARVEAITEVNSNLRLAITMIGQDVKKATYIAVPNVAGATSTSLQIVTTEGASVEYCLVAGRMRRQVNSPCSVDSTGVTGDSVVVDSLTFSRMENTNAILSKTAITVGVDLGVHYASEAPKWQYAATKQTAISAY